MYLIKIFTSINCWLSITLWEVLVAHHKTLLLKLKSNYHKTWLLTFKINFHRTQFLKFKWKGQKLRMSASKSNFQNYRLLTFESTWVKTLLLPFKWNRHKSRLLTFKSKFRKTLLLTFKSKPCKPAGTRVIASASGKVLSVQIVDVWIVKTIKKKKTRKKTCRISRWILVCWYANKIFG